MNTPPSLHSDRFPRFMRTASILLTTVKDCPIISPHGHTDLEWFTSNRNFLNATELLLVHDRYVLRLLCQPLFEQVLNENRRIGHVENH